MSNPLDDLVATHEIPGLQARWSAALLWTGGQGRVHARFAGSVLIAAHGIGQTRVSSRALPGGMPRRMIFGSTHGFQDGTTLLRWQVGATVNFAKSPQEGQTVNTITRMTICVLAVGLAACGGHKSDPGQPVPTMLIAAGGPAPSVSEPVSVPASEPAVLATGPIAGTLAGALECGPGESWRPTSLSGAPGGRYWHGAVWTGTEMMVWGGTAGGKFLSTGALYNPVTDTWRPVPESRAPSGRLDMVMAWTGDEVLVWGGRAPGPQGHRDGARFDPERNTWSPMSSLNAPPPTVEPEGVWTGRELVVWGDDTSEGARYDPARDLWIPMTTRGAPTPRDGYVMVAADDHVLVWGGRARGPYVNTGGRYHLASDTWRPMSVVDAPAGTYWASGVWTGAELLVFAGRICGSTGCDTAIGGRYSLETDSWRELSTQGAPEPRFNHASGAWTGRHMIVWGGGSSMLGSGGVYDPSRDRWTPMTGSGAPAGRYLHTGIWTDAGFITWGGITKDNSTAQDGGVYCPPPHLR